MKTKIIFLIITISTIQCFGASRKEALAPHIDLVMKRFSDLPEEYQETHQQTLEQYLNLFTSSNDIQWNSEWGSFIETMGKEFAPLKADVIEAMLIAEAYQACYPNPESRISDIASSLFSEIPTNSIVFIHQDLFETILRIEQQTSDRRKDVIVINSARILDNTYRPILATRYPSLAGLDGTLITRVFDEARKLKEAGNEEFESLQVINGKVTMNGYDMIASGALLMAKEISKSNPSRPVVFLPAVREFWKPVPAWNTLQVNGIFCTWSDTPDTKGSNSFSSWSQFIDTVAPANSPLQARLSNSLGRVVNAHAFICKSNGDDNSAKKIFGYCGERMKNVRMVKGENITIDKSGKMVEPAH
jgi:hypothetical protein